jgi:hypothetical protein
MRYGNITPPGWEYEPADPSVGLMDEGWWHCGDDLAEVEMLGGAWPPPGVKAMYITFTIGLTCPTCRATATVERDEFCGDYDEPLDTDYA